jgi:hypothetical protein
MAKTAKLSFDFSDRPEVAETLRWVAMREKTSQKDVVVRALEAYFSHELEQTMIAVAADKTFTEWDNEDDAVYDNF